MPRNIMIPEEEEKSPHNLIIVQKGNEKRSSACSNMSEEDPMFEGKWRTNLLITQEQERVERRDRGCRKNTSFQNKIINDHIKVMIRCVCQKEHSDMGKCQKACNTLSHQQSIIKDGIVKEKVEELINSNIYLTEEQKTDFVPMFSQNFDNYQILIKTMSRLNSVSLLGEQLTFMLFKMVEFISNSYQVKLRKYDEEFMQDQISKRLPEVSSLITTHENVKLINPEYFYNINESKYLHIVECWLYCIFAIKLGIYGNKYIPGNQSTMEMMI